MAPGVNETELTDIIVQDLAGKVFSDIGIILGSLPPNLLTKIETLIIVLQAVGIAFIVYVFYLLFSFIINWRRAMMVKKLDEKMDLVLEKLNIKQEKEQKKKEKRKKKR